MSDPRSNLEIMDVLSSIRRLVSGDLKAVPKELPADAPKAEDAAEGQPEPAAAPGVARFVLTPALRVAEADLGSEAEALQDAGDDLHPGTASESQQAWREDAQADEAAVRPKATGDLATIAAAKSASLEETIAELEAAVGEIETGFEPDSGDAVDAEPAPLVQNIWKAGRAAVKPAGEFHGIMAGFDAMTALEDRLDSPITAELLSDASPRVPSDFRRATPHDGRATPELPERLPEAPSAAKAAPPAEPAGAARFEGTLAAHSKEWTGEDREIATEAEAGFEDEMEAGVAADAGEAGEDLIGAAGPGEPVADDGSAADRQSSDPESGAAAQDAANLAPGRLHFGGNAAARSLIFRPDAAKHDDAPLPLDAVNEGEADDGQDAGGDDLFDPLNASEIDIDMLRDMVSEIIREELRGTLGERITRNLRQLVRREIERALEAERAAKD